MAEGVQIIDVTQISLPPLPQTPTRINLSFFDSVWVAVPPIQRLMLYSTPNTNLSFPSLVQLLKSSLSATLLHYLPLVGKLTYVSSTGDVDIDFATPDVTFVTAESDLDLRQLITNEVHDVGSFMRLVPTIDVSILPCSIFAVQVTRFLCGGVAVGYSVHHTIADGKALLQFVEAWTSACRTKMDDLDLPIERYTPVMYDRSLIKHPNEGEIARKFLRMVAPTLPSTASSFTSIVEVRLQLRRRAFILDAKSIRDLKTRATQHEPPSTFSAISAHVWACIARSKSSDSSQNTFFFFLMDCRARLEPPVHDNYFGNCVCGVCSKILAGELMGENGLIKACAAIRESIDEVLKDPLSHCETWIEDFMALPNEDL